MNYLCEKYTECFFIWNYAYPSKTLLELTMNHKTKNFCLHIPVIVASGQYTYITWLKLLYHSSLFQMALRIRYCPIYEIRHKVRQNYKYATSMEIKIFKKKKDQDVYFQESEIKIYRMQNKTNHQD